MKIANKRDFAIKISGNHYFACDYVFSNIYGDSVFMDEETAPSADYFPSIKESESLLLDTLPETHIDTISSMPECTKEIEYMTEGSVISDEKNDIFIRYGGDDSPMCLHIRNDGAVSLSGEEFDSAEIIFEKGKRNYISLPLSLFNDTPKDQSIPEDLQSPLNICVSTEDIKNNMTKNGGSLSVSYSIEVNGIVAEVTDFTLTADEFTHPNGF